MKFLPSLTIIPQLYENVNTVTSYVVMDNQTLDFLYIIESCKIAKLEIII